MAQASGLIVFLLTRFSAAAEPPVAQDTTAPNTFWFSSDTFSVDEDATNAIVSVEFNPGDRGWSGWVNYSVSNGTAVAGEDYVPVSGTLYFSGPAPLQIKIPIRKDNLRESNETVQLFLWNTNAVLTRSNATLVIGDKNQNPPLRIAPGPDQTIALSWPSDYSDFVLEKSSEYSTSNWTVVSSPRIFTNGVCQVNEPSSAAPVFFRLRQAAAP